MNLTETDLALAAQALRNHAHELMEDTSASTAYILRLRSIAAAIDPQKALLPVEVAS